MARISKAPDGGKFRARAAAALDGEPGVWGDADLLVVDFDASGELILAAAVGDAKGVIWTREGRNSYAGEMVSTINEVVGGKVYTVFRFAEIQEIADSTPALAAGDLVYSTTAGGVTVTPAAGAIFLGSVHEDDTVRGSAGLRLVLDVGRLPGA